MSENSQINVNKNEVQNFLTLHSKYQHRIYSFIMSFVADWNEADDIYQETLSVLWSKFNSFSPGSDFLSWAFKIAHFQVLSHLKKQKSQKKYFCQDVLDNLKEVAIASAADSDQSLKALRICMKKLTDRNRHLLSMRYEEGATVQSIALRLQQSVNTLYKKYQQIHGQLLLCVLKQMKGDF
ncbi:MAG TPA: sigma-70 family RNA polymerase sigma factor [Anaerohalosphaeraceae bacterium]|nr:sigma-70 family RNA polymerase sigma factor [Anaerohalosphaeraceae bacterium]